MATCVSKLPRRPLAVLVGRGTMGENGRVGTITVSSLGPSDTLIRPCKQSILLQITIK